MGLKIFFGCCGQWIVVEREWMWEDPLGKQCGDQIDHIAQTGRVRHGEKSTDFEEIWEKTPKDFRWVRY